MSSNQSNESKPKAKKGNKIFGVMTKRRWFGVVVFLSAMLWTYTAGPPLNQAVVSNRYFKDGVIYDYSTVRFEGDITLIDTLFKRGFWPHVFTWQLGAYFNWTEGPTLMDDGRLFFSDVVKNRIYSYAPIQGTQIEMENSGDCSEDQLDKLYQPGSNGLLKHPQQEDTIFIAQQCQRRIISFNFKTQERKVIAREYKGKKLNSPNDLILGPNKKYIYFTDPPYGFQAKHDPNATNDEIAAFLNDASKSELGFAGVYRVAISGESEVELLDKSVLLPNGIAFSTDFKRLFVSNSVSDRYEIVVFDVNAKGLVTKSTIWDQKYLLRNSKQLETPVTPLMGDGTIDGIDIHPRGYLITTAPGAKICMVDENTGDLKGVIKMADLLRISNVAVAKDEYLYVTGNHTVWQLKLQPFSKSGIKAIPKTDI